ncbi:hypothetical protein V9T40_005435 [Parthenolecanium corni]|uniref:CHK kinase-like domain-containing protein n=1 Tax=Parthenolecanium corni TaxID=536013 RepID=A0AAN9TVW0_9HEMI
MLLKMAPGLSVWMIRLFITQAVIQIITAGDLSQSKDLNDAVEQFINNFEARGKAIITSYRINDDVANAEDHSFSGVASLEFKYKMRKFRKTKFGKVILKIPSLAPMPHERLSAFQLLFDREVHFYKTILPKLYRLGQCEPFAPRLYAVTEAKALVLEDLRINGFKASDQTIPLYLDECKISLEVLAQYHALGYKYLQSVNKNDPNWSLIKLSPMGKANMNMIDEFVKKVKPHLSAQLYKIILRLRNELQTTEEYPNQNRITVLIHGDFRTSNIFFKYDVNNQVCGVKVIDWQFSREANPVVDLFIFFVQSVSIKMMENNGIELFNFYLHHLNNNLNLLEAKRSYNKPELIADIIYYRRATGEQETEPPLFQNAENSSTSSNTFDITRASESFSGVTTITPEVTTPNNTTSATALVRTAVSNTEVNKTATSPAAEMETSTNSKHSVTEPPISTPMPMIMSTTDNEITNTNAPIPNTQEIIRWLNNYLKNISYPFHFTN